MEQRPLMNTSTVPYPVQLRTTVLSTHVHRTGYGSTEGEHLGGSSSVNGAGRREVHDSEFTCNPTYLGCLNHLICNLLSLLDLLGGHGSLGSEVKAKAVRRN